MSRDSRLEEVAWWVLTGAPLEPGLEGIATTMWGQGYTVDEALDALRLLAGIKNGSSNPYLLARAQGLSRPEAQRHAATAAYLEVSEVFGADRTFELDTDRAQGRKAFGFARDL
jgi:hypothetical protein